MRKLLSFHFMPFIIASAVFIFFQLRIYNIGLGFRDEGFLYLNAARILNGELPYRDFFMTTTPGSFYLQALINQLFGTYIIWDRILYFIFVILILLLVNLIYKLENVKKYIVLLSLAIFFLGHGVFAYYNIEALFFILVGFYFLNLAFNKKNRWYLFVAGVSIGLAFIFKQSFGGWVGVGLIYIILFESIKQNRIKEVISFGLGSLFILIPFFLYFYVNNALSQFVYYTAIFSREVKEHRSPFIFKALVSIPLFYFVFKFLFISFLKLIKKNLKQFLILFFLVFLFFEPLFTSYFELSRLYYAAFIIFPVSVLALVKKNQKTYMIRWTAIILLVLFFANASSGRELGALMWVSPFYIPLIILVYEHIVKNTKQNKAVTTLAVCGFILFQALYFSINSINIHEKVKSEISTNFTKGVKVSGHTKNEIQKLLAKISTYPKEKKILCFPYCPMINPLTKRDSPSYFNFFYPEAFLPDHQRIVIEEIKISNPILVIQKKGTIEAEADFEDVRFGKLKRYIVRNYRKVYQSKNFEIYE